MHSGAAREEPQFGETHFLANGVSRSHGTTVTAPVWYLGHTIHLNGDMVLPYHTNTNYE